MELNSPSSFAASSVISYQLDVKDPNEVGVHPNMSQGTSLYYSSDAALHLLITYPNDIDVQLVKNRVKISRDTNAKLTLICHETQFRTIATAIRQVAGSKLVKRSVPSDFNPDARIQEIINCASIDLRHDQVHILAVHGVVYTKDEGTMDNLSNIDMNDSYARRLKWIWDTQVGTRTILYYSCLLGRDASEQSIHQKLPELTSLAGGQHSQILTKLAAEDIVEPNTGYLNRKRNADRIVARLIMETMGGKPFSPPFNGLEIVESNIEKREELWVRNGIGRWLELFGDGKVKGLNISTSPIDPLEHHKGQLVKLYLETEKTLLVIMYLNTERMKDDQGIQDGMTAYFHANREATRIRATPISVIAAPTYDYKVSQYFTFEYPTPMLGPINMAIFSHGFENRKDSRTEDFLALLRFLEISGSNINAIEFFGSIDAT